MITDIGMLGKKIGMTQVYNPDGTVTGVTAVEVGPCIVLGKRTNEKDGYCAIQLGFEDKPEKNVNMPRMGSFTKSKITPKRYVGEFRVSSDIAEKYETGQELKADFFSMGDFVDVRGLSKGKGFAGVFKKFSFSGGKATHGVHECYRHGGSLGQNMTPGRVMKGKKMPGHLGNTQTTVQNLEVVRVFCDDNIVFIKGPIPGGRNTLYKIKSAVKKKKAVSS